MLPQQLRFIAQVFRFTANARKKNSFLLNCAFQLTSLHQTPFARLFNVPNEGLRLDSTDYPTLGEEMRQKKNSDFTVLQWPNFKPKCDSDCKFPMEEIVRRGRSKRLFWSTFPAFQDKRNQSAERHSEDARSTIALLSSDCPSEKRIFSQNASENILFVEIIPVVSQNLLSPYRAFCRQKKLPRDHPNVIPLHYTSGGSAKTRWLPLGAWSNIIQRERRTKVRIKHH